MVPGIIFIGERVVFKFVGELVVFKYNLDSFIQFICLFETSNCELKNMESVDGVHKK